MMNFMRLFQKRVGFLFVFSASLILLLLSCSKKKDESNHSPIMEMIQAISLANFQNQKTSVKNKLFIVSDMIQNTPEYSIRV